MTITFTVNGGSRISEMGPMSRLIDVLREEFGLTGTKEGCGEGECGSCAVLLDGEPVNACLVPVGQCAGRQLITVEGLAKKQDEATPMGGFGDKYGHLSPLQASLIEGGGTQCGFCTPGVLIAAEALLRREKNPDEQDVRWAIAGNLCRCTGYQRIVDSVLEAAERLREEPSSPEAEG